MPNWENLSDLSRRAIDPGDIFGESSQSNYDYMGNVYRGDPEAFRIGDRATQYFDRLATQRQGQGPAQMQAGTMRAAQIDMAPQAQFRSQQQQLGNAMMERAMGRGGPSPAELQLQSGMEKNIAAAQAMSAGSANPALASRNAMRAATQAGLETNQQAALLRAQEQLAAQQQAGALIGAARGQDVGLAGQQAGFQQGANQMNLQAQMQAGQANLGATMQQRAMNDQMTQYYMNQGFGRDQAQQQAAADMEKMIAGQYASANIAAGQQAMANAQMEAQKKAGILSAAGGVVGMFA